MEKSLKLNSNEEAAAIYGSLDANLRFAEKEYNVRISARNHVLKIMGDKRNVEDAVDFFQTHIKAYREESSPKKKKHEAISEESVELSTSSSQTSASKEKGDVAFSHRGKLIRGRTKNQSRYLEAIRDFDVVFGIGPAGTGKTYLAMAAALEYLKRKLISRIVLVRPAVEAGENLGFLPGDLQEKVNPYLRPLYDALHDMSSQEDGERMLERGIIEVVPLAYMRGRTLNDSFVILDEAQNTTHTQMKMFLTRMGESSKMVVTGDITQIDLPGAKVSGLVEARNILKSVKEIKFIMLEKTDVVRHPLVQQILKAYEKFEQKKRP